jgi:FliI/YscN family ATPase
MPAAVSLERYFHKVSIAPADRPSGEVVQVVGLAVEVAGLKASVGDTLEITREGGGDLQVEVVGFRGNRLVATPLGELVGVHPGARVHRSDRGMFVHAGNHLLGRIVDAFARPLDSKPLFADGPAAPLRANPPSAFSRRPIDRPLSTGIRAIDGFLTLGRGQRIGIFAGAGVGKSTLLGMICRNAQADVNVIALVGERGREVNEFVREVLGQEGLDRSVVIAATSDQPPLVRSRAAECATAVAESFRDKGLSVLLVMDSLTRYAMALRETALASGEPPATKGYPPSVFAALPRLLERPGTCVHDGVITAIYTVLVEGDDLSDPIADAARSILDGHIVLSRALAEQGHFPAIDILKSLSRLATSVAPSEQIAAASALRGHMATLREVEDLIQIGAYVSGSDPRVDRARELVPAIDAFLRQGISERTFIAESRARLGALAQHDR